MLLLSLILSAALAQDHPCRPVPEVGCWYGPADWDGTVLVYLRGHHPDRGAGVPRAELTASARQAFEAYGLQAAADSARARVLVTGGSPIVVAAGTLARLEPKRVVVAAHSGGVAALEHTLAGLPAVDRVVLLDMFYGERRVDGVAQLSRTARTVARAGAACSGFFTAHNRDRYERLFRDEAPQCAVVDGSAFGHNAGVNRCLAAFLSGTDCR